MALAGAALASAQQAPPRDPRWAVIVSGASGGPEYAKQLATWRQGIQTALTSRFGYPAAQILQLVDETARDAGTPATADNVKKTFASLQGRVGKDDSVLIVLLGHGTFDGQQAKFNLVGPDLTAADWGTMLNAVPGRLVVVNTTESSAPFLEALAARGRVVITATETTAQKYATVFPEYFVKALGDAQADLDKNGRTSIWEAFSYAARLQKEYFEQKGQLASERAALEDNGDGVGREGAATSGEDGMLATMTYLDAVVDARPTDPQLQMLLQRQDVLTQELDALRRKKASMPQAEYDAAFEKLMVDLATLGAEIRRRGGGGSN